MMPLRLTLVARLFDLFMIGQAPLINYQLTNSPNRWWKMVAIPIDTHKLELKVGGSNIDF